MRRWTPAYIGLGSNLDDPELQVQRAFDGLADLAESRLVARSPTYRSAPMGPQDQPAYINAVAGLLTLQDATGLWSDLQTLEQRLGRCRDPRRWGPRRIDLDLLLFGDQTIETEDLTVPHPGLKARNFVIFPLAHIAPDIVLPDGTRLDILRRETGDSGLQRMVETDKVSGDCEP